MSDTTTKDAENAAPSPMDGLKDAVRGLGQSALSYGMSRVGDSAGKLTDRLTGFAEGKRPDDGEGDDEGATGPVGQAMQGGIKAAVSGDNPVAGALKGAATGVKDKIKEKLP